MDKLKSKELKKTSKVFLKKSRFFRIFFSLITGLIYVLFFIELFNIISFFFYDLKIKDDVIVIYDSIFILICLIVLILIIKRVDKYGSYKYILFGLIFLMIINYWQYYQTNKCENIYFSKPRTGFCAKEQTDCISPEEAEYIECMWRAGNWISVGY